MKQRDGESTRAAILEAAISLFSARGFAGVSVDQIAKAAGVQRSLLLYHFGSKPKLWAAVAEHRLGPYLQQLALEVERTPDEDFVPRLVGRHFRFLQDNPDLVRLVLWHKLEAVFSPDEAGAGPAPEGAGLLGGLEARLVRLQHDGRIRGDLRPENLVVALLGLVEYWFQSAPMHQALAQPARAPSGPGDAYLADVVRLVDRGLRPE